MRNKLIFILALIFGLMAAYLVYNYLNHVNKSANLAYSDVLVAAQDIPANTAIASKMMEVKSFPTEFRNGKEIIDIKDAVGKVSLITINKGQVIITNQLIKPGDTGEGLAYAVPEGYRAMSVPIDEVSGVGGMLQGGDRVDIIAEISIGQNPPLPRSVVVLQNVAVLAVGTNLSPAKSSAADKTASAKTATVAVNLPDSLRLKMAIQRGNITLLLRSPADQSTANPMPFGDDGFNIPAAVPAGKV